MNRVIAGSELQLEYELSEPKEKTEMSGKEMDPNIPYHSPYE